MTDKYVVLTDEPLNVGEVEVGGLSLLAQGGPGAPDVAGLVLGNDALLPSPLKLHV